MKKLFYITLSLAAVLLIYIILSITAVEKNTSIEPSIQDDIVIDTTINENIIIILNHLRDDTSELSNEDFEAIANEVAEDYQYYLNNEI